MTITYLLYQSDKGKVKTEHLRVVPNRYVATYEITNMEGQADAEKHFKIHMNIAIEHHEWSQQFFFQKFVF